MAKLDSATDPSCRTDQHECPWVALNYQRQIETGFAHGSMAFIRHPAARHAPPTHVKTISRRRRCFCFSHRRPCGGEHLGRGYGRAAHDSELLPAKHSAARHPLEPDRDPVYFQPLVYAATPAAHHDNGLLQSATLRRRARGRAHMNFRRLLIRGSWAIRGYHLSPLPVLLPAAEPRRCQTRLTTPAPKPIVRAITIRWAMVSTATRHGAYCNPSTRRWAGLLRSVKLRLTTRTTICVSPLASSIATLSRVFAKSAFRACSLGASSRAMQQTANSFGR